MSTPSFEVVTDGLRFPEGPVWMKDGSVLVCEVFAGRITRVAPNGQKTVVATTGGGPNGAAVGPDGKLYVCNNGVCVRGVDGAATGRTIVDFEGGVLSVEGAAAVTHEGGRIQRVDLSSGEVETLYTSCDDRPLGAPNDLVFDDDGGFWFTDRGHSGAVAHSHGGLFYARADGGQIIRAVDRLSGNGVGLSPDGTTLYVALTDERQILAFDKLGPGKLAPIGNIASGRVVGTLPGRQLLDSMAIMADGKIAQAAIWERSGIAVFDPVTGEVDRLDFPDHFTTNICFGGADMGDAWITLSESGRLVKVRWNTPGLRLNHYI